MGRVFAVLPAAGKSRRMGCPKLLLPWEDGRVIDAVLRVWLTAGVDQVIVVCRRADIGLREACQRWPVSVVCPREDPVDMKRSIQVGLEYVEQAFTPNELEHWMTAPADLPSLKKEVIKQLLDSRIPHKVVVPRFGDHPSHPSMLPWSLVERVFQLKEGQGMNKLLEGEVVNYLDLPPEAYAPDMDTPDEYRKLRSPT